jgi:hypothetical protein
VSGVHLAFVYLNYFVFSTTLNEETKTAIGGFLKSRYSTVYDDIHVLSFYLDPLFVPAREASRRCQVKPGEESSSDASRCLAAAATLTREANVEEQQEVRAAVIAVCMGGATYFCTATSTPSSARAQLPHAWWALFCNMAPVCIRRLAQLVFSCAPTSAAGERSFKQRSWVHSRIRNRLSGGNADRTPAILFNGQQIKRVAAGVLAQPRVCAMESRMLDAIVSGAAAPAVGVVVGYDDDSGAEIAGESRLQGVDGVELGGAAVGDSIALADVEALLVSMLAEDDV